MNKTRRIILISAKSNINEQITGLRLGAVAYITKPFDPLYLKAMVQSQLYNMATLRKGFPNKKAWLLFLSKKRIRSQAFLYDNLYQFISSNPSRSCWQPH